MNTQIGAHGGVVLDLEGAETLGEALRRWCAAVRDLAAVNRDSDPQWSDALVRAERDVFALVERYVGLAAGAGVRLALTDQPTLEQAMQTSAAGECA